MELLEAPLSPSWKTWGTLEAGWQYDSVPYLVSPHHPLLLLCYPDRYRSSSSSFSSSYFQEPDRPHERDHAVTIVHRGLYWHIDVQVHVSFLESSSDLNTHTYHHNMGWGGGRRKKKGGQKKKKTPQLIINVRVAMFTHKQTTAAMTTVGWIMVPSVTAWQFMPTTSFIHMIMSRPKSATISMGQRTIGLLTRKG